MEYDGPDTGYKSWHHDGYPFWISRDGHDPSQEVAFVETRAGGRSVMRYMLENAEEDGPLFLFGPGITLPDRCMFDDDGYIVIDFI